MALALAPACGDDGGTNPTPDASLPNVDAASNIDAAGNVDASNIDASNIDASNIDASNPADAGVPDAMGPDAMPLVGLAAARGAADGSVNVTIANVLVTYKKALLGNDVAGFFVQVNMTGPALFIAIDPTTLTPEPQVGDDVSFVITTMGTSSLQRQAEAVTGWTVNSSGNSITGLIQDVSSAGDLVTAVGDYESELIGVTLRVADVLGSSGTSHMHGTVETTGVTGDINLKLRVPTTMQDTYGFVANCMVTTTSTPLWRFGANVQVSVYSDSEFTATCPTPNIVSVSAPSATEVAITYDRAIDGTSITAVATQFTFDNGLTASAFSVNGRVVTLTTGTQSVGQAYMVTVAGEVLDVLAGSAAGSGNFTGFGVPEASCDDGVDNDSDGFVDCLDTNCSGDSACTFLAQPYIWETDAQTPGTDAAEFVEIRNMASTTLDLTDYYVLFINGNGDVSYAAYQLTGTLAPGALFMLGNTAVTGVDITFAGNFLQNGADGVLLVSCPTCTDASDFPNGTDITDFPTFTVNTHTATKIDSVAYDDGDADDAGLLQKLGVSVQYQENDTNSVQRTSLSGFSISAAPTPDATGVQP